MRCADPSLLPRHRGPAPIHHTILSGDANAGISIIEVAPGDFDVGRVLLQQAVPLADGVHRCTLEDTLAAAGAQAILEVLRRLPEYRAASFSQESTGQAVSYAPKLTRAAGTIEWGTARKDELDALYRAAGDQIGVHTRVGGKRVRLDGLFTARRAASVASISPATSSRHRPGNAILVGDKKSPVLAIRCSDGWVGCTRLTVAVRLDPGGLVALHVLVFNRPLSPWADDGP